MSTLAGTAVQLGLSYSGLLTPSANGSTFFDDRHNLHLAVFQTWEAMAEDLGGFATAVEEWAKGRRFNNWYDLLDQFAETYMRYRYDDISEALVPFTTLILIATGITPAEEDYR